MRYPFKEIEKKWQQKWQQSGLHKVDFADHQKKFYALVMFCYPSSDKLHLGHWLNFAPCDTWARFKKLQGYNVFAPQGFDSFGLPAENYAIKIDGHPQDITEENIRVIRKQLKAIGAMYDWDQEIITSRPEYYKWTQWIFLQLYKAGMAYRKDAPVNWCSSCNTVLANEQVTSKGICERCDTPITKKNLKQWFFKITAYADRLLRNLDWLDWPEKTKTMQRNWIGRSEGSAIHFPLADGSIDSIEVFTTRPDTLFGVTYLVLAPEHPLVGKITTPPQKLAVKEYIKEALKTSEIERSFIHREKFGVFTGALAINPVNEEKIPIWIADYVLPSYGTGAVMAVPGHDERDYDFATNMELPIRKVILEPGTAPKTPLQKAYIGEGTLINSGDFDGLSSQEARKKIRDWLTFRNLARHTINYRLRDWLVSRQRYWGAPIPIIYCKSCGEVPVSISDLPVLLPYDVNFRPSGESPLKSHNSFLETTCPTCGNAATREADTLDTFVDSSWYFLRYLSPGLASAPFDKKIARKWCPVDKYVGGVDHATMHLLYARFVNMVLYDLNHINFEEPFTSLFHQGTLKGPDGQKMSKSRGNAISPDAYLEKYGADVLRCYLMFRFEYATAGAWDDSEIDSINRFLNRIWRVFQNCLWVFKAGNEYRDWGEKEIALKKVLHRSIKGATQDTERMHFNTAISRLMELVNELLRYTSNAPYEEQNAALLKEVLETFNILLAPYMPHLAEELWEISDHNFSIFNQQWPEFDPSVLESEFINYVIQINGKVREKMRVTQDLSEADIKETALTSGRISKLISGKNVLKIILVPGKLINIVVK